MRELYDGVKYTLNKGELLEVAEEGEDTVIKSLKVTKNNTVEDEINLTEFLEKVIDFCSTHVGKQVQATFEIKSVE